MIGNEYKVSVIVPAHNTECYLKKCLDSLLNQSITSIEIILVDDGSQPPLDSFISDNYSKFTNLVYLRNEAALGPGAARNKGLNIAKGEFIGFCDSDDWVDLNLYETIVDSMENHNAEIGVFSTIREYDYDKNKKSYMCHFNKHYSLSSEMAIHILSGTYNMGIKLLNACWNKLFRKDFLIDIGTLFEEGIYFQGILFNVSTFLYARKIICVPGTFYHHYKRENSIVQSFNSKHIHDFGKCYTKMKAYFEKFDSFERYRYDFISLCNEYMNLVVKEIFEFIPNESERKKHLRILLDIYSSLVSRDDYFEYASAEQIRRHIQPHVEDTRLY